MSETEMTAPTWPIGMSGNNSFGRHDSSVNDAHPEMRPGERFLSNVTAEVFGEIRWKTKRLGRQAYDIHGRPFNGAFPVFVLEAEAAALREEMEKTWLGPDTLPPEAADPDKWDAFKDSVRIAAAFRMLAEREMGITFHKFDREVRVYAAFAVLECEPYGDDRLAAAVRAISRAVQQQDEQRKEKP